MNPTLPLIGRLAPSPTGALHLGNARSFLLAWLDVRSKGGKLLLRIEDLDGPRNKVGAASMALEDLQWLGLDWDEGPIYQRPRLAEYRQALKELHTLGLAYPCVCTRKDVEAAGSAPHQGEEGPFYPGTCRGRWDGAEEALAETGKSVCWRYAIPSQSRVHFVDRVAGDCHFEMDSGFGDFVIWKKDDEPAYQLAVVVDDGQQGVSSVLRGKDLLSSAGRQILIFNALGLPVPEYAHVPLVTGQDGRRLAKRHGDTTLRKFRQDGYSASDILTWLANSLEMFATDGGHLQKRVKCPAELLSSFDLGKLPTAPVVWDGKLEAG